MSENPKDVISAGRYEVTAPVDGNPLELETITAKDILHEAPEAGGVTITHIRHGKYERNTTETDAGSLTEEAVEGLEDQTRELITDIIDSTPESDRANLRFLFAASPTVYVKGQRSMETGVVMTEATRRCLAERGLESTQILNDSDAVTLKTQEGDPEGSPRPITDIEEPRIFSDDTGFLEYICEAETNRLQKEGKLGEGERVEPATLPFFIAYESDWYRAERLRRGAEGPHEMSNRIMEKTKVLARYARKYQNRPGNEDTRLVVIAASHYDVISPLVRDKVLGMDEETSNNTILQVDYGGGVTISLKSSKDGEGTVVHDGHEHTLAL